MAKQNETNGTTEAPKGPSKIDELHALWVRDGSKDPPAVESKKLVAAYLTAKKAKAAAKKAVEEAQKKESLAVEALIRWHGKGRLRIDGEICIPMLKGDTVFFRGEGKGEVKDLG